MGSLATIRGLHKAYVMGDETVHALDGVDLNFDRGEYIAILGPSGSGKSTLMHILGFMDTPTKGSILFEGEEVSNLSPDRRAWYRSNRVGFVFQSFNLLPRLSVLENVALPLLYREDYTEDAREEAAKIALERVGMSHRLTHRPTQLSGGERQRVAIARAIVARPAIVFADEPTGNLDVKNVDRILDLLGSLLAEGITVVVVTHDLSVAAKAKRVISMRAGKVQEDRLQ
ncbi:macrolide export ATP-binding/permease protein MacB [Verrucomicrobiota bacterium]|jgi:putative ABC transport system ATP-binding protein|nr:macrolide export ATP-binding/permease protein MacB [Verrucomicrobiota bacterium]